MGTLQNIYVPPPTNLGKAWYINDHTIVRGPDNLWHMFGITHEEPANPSQEETFAHATSPTLTAARWTFQAKTLTTDTASGERLLWAPYILEYAGLYYMYYCAGGQDSSHFQIKLATSPDLMTWTRAPAPLIIDGYDARDPFVLRVGDHWVLYYTATSTPTGGNHVVGYRTSTDLRTWTGGGVAYRDPSTGTFGGPTESPFVVANGSGYYLFIGPRTGYSSTGVFYSTDPVAFTPGGALPNSNSPQLFPTHATEVVVDFDGKSYMTHAGWGEGWLWLAPLTWTCN